MSIKSWVRQHKTNVIFVAILMVELYVIFWGWNKYQEALNPPTKRSSTPTELKIFKTIKLGGIRDAEGFRQVLKDNGMKIDDWFFWADQIMSQPKFTITQEETEVDLVVVSATDIGFERDATREQIYARAKEKGLELCPPDVGPQLRLQYKDQPEWQRLLIGMEPITVWSNMEVFGLENINGRLWLTAHTGNPDFAWSKFESWVFIRPRK
jgi:hypothetical protein